MANRFCTSCGKPVDEGAASCTSCGATVKTNVPTQKPEPIPLAPPILENAGGSEQMTFVPHVPGRLGGVQYKTVAGPIKLQAKNQEDYETAVKKYAAIIDAEAVGGWELHLIQQIAVNKWLWHTVIIGAIAGAVLGCFGIRNITKFFNMLVFVKRD